MGSSSSLTAVRARSKRFSDILPSSKQMVLRPTQPTDRLSSSSGSNPSPMTTSVDPPPISMTKPLVGAHGAGVRDTGVNQTRFFESGNDFDGVAESGACSFQKPALALCAPQRIGADHSHAIRLHRAQPLAETLEAAQRAIGGGFVQAPAVAHTGREAHHFAQPVQYDELVVRIPRDDHVKAV